MTLNEITPSARQLALLLVPATLLASVLFLTGPVAADLASDSGTAQGQIGSDLRTAQSIGVDPVAAHSVERASTCAPSAGNDVSHGEMHQYRSEIGGVRTPNSFSVAARDDTPLDNVTTTMYVAPAGADFETANLTRSNDLAVEDELFVRVDSRRLAANVSVGDRIGGIDGGVEGMVARMSAPCYGFHETGDELAATIVDVDQETGEFWIHYDTLPDPFLGPGVTHDLEFSTASPLVDRESQEGYVTDEFNWEIRELTVDSVELTSNGTALDVTVATTLAPGTEVTVRAYADDVVGNATGTVRETDAGSRRLTLQYDTPRMEIGGDVVLKAEDPGTDGDQLSTATVTVEPPEPSGAFAVSVERVRTFEDRGHVEVDVGVQNVGSEARTERIELSVGGESVDATELTLDSGESDQMTLSWDAGAADADTYTAAVASEHDRDATEFTLDRRSATDESGIDDDDNGDDETDDSGTDADGRSNSGRSDDGIPGFGVAVSVASMLATILLAINRRD